MKELQYGTMGLASFEDKIRVSVVSALKLTIQTIHSVLNLGQYPDRSASTLVSTLIASCFGWIPGNISIS